jgi:transcriptional regulator NrdR family protein
VRRSGDGKIGRTPFDRDRLFRDVADAVFHRGGRDDEDRIDRVVTRTVIRLERSLPLLSTELSTQEREEFPHLRAVVDDTTIADIVEEEMTASRMRIQRVLYALSIRGRQDHKGRTGWSNASVMLAWLQTAYPKLQIAAEPPTVPRGGTEWTLLRQPPLPIRVVKKDGRSPANFHYDQFLKGIAKACIGRRDADRLSETVALRVLTGVSGQGTVHSSQLGVGVLDALRHLDDIAFLRWATILKKTYTVTDFAVEAQELVSHPSPRPNVRYT